MKKIFFALVLSLFTLQNAYGLITVDITRGNLDPLPIAVSPLHVDNKSEKGILGLFSLPTKITNNRETNPTTSTSQIPVIIAKGII